MGKTFLATKLSVALANIGGRSCAVIDANMNSGQAKVKATPVNTMVIVMASLIFVGVPGLVLFMRIGFF